ncbi:MAG: aldose epimerase [Bacillales bacterium]|jgi:galactose mutarotase-like enzyme|nr:aldose epimerase [Bacillales bacterium]
MAVTKKMKYGYEVLEITEKSTNSRAVICPERGGILLELILNGEEILYLNEETVTDTTKNIRGGNPILFPISGAIADNQYNVDGEIISLKQHGFARNMPWDVDGMDDSSVTLTLQDTDESFEVYPYEFLITFTYVLEEGKMLIHQQYENHSDLTMPFYAGFHPYFLGNHKETTYEIPSKKYMDTSTFEFHNQETPLEQMEIEPSKAFYDLSEQKVVIGQDNKKVILTFSKEFPVVVVWSETPEKYVCVEPWMAGPNAFHTEEKVINLKPGQMEIATFTIANGE